MISDLDKLVNLSPVPITPQIESSRDVEGIEKLPVVQGVGKRCRSTAKVKFQTPFKPPFK